VFIPKKIRDFALKITFTSMQVLVLDNNRLSTLKNFPIIKSLDTLSVNNNNFSSALDFTAYCLEKVKPSLIF
jgi:hypothetical protein